MRDKPLVPCILPNEFTAFAALLVADVQFPKTYASWLQLTYRSDLAASVDIHPHEFADYCSQQKKQPCMSALREFAQVKALSTSNVK